MFQWGLVLVAATAIIFIGASANIPFFERTNYATSVQTREDFKTANTPDLSRSQAIADVKMFISENCTNGDEYLSGLPHLKLPGDGNPGRMIFMTVLLMNGLSEILLLITSGGYMKILDL